MNNSFVRFCWCPIEHPVCVLQKIKIKRGRYGMNCYTIYKPPKNSKTSHKQSADLGSPGGCQPASGSHQPNIWPIFPKNRMKMKKIGSRGRASKILLCRSVTDKVPSLTWWRRRCSHWVGAGIPGGWGSPWRRWAPAPLGPSRHRSPRPTTHPSTPNSAASENDLFYNY